MDPTAIIPAYQPLPLPAPLWLLYLLLVLGFFLHAIPMNVVLGGSFTSAALLFNGRNNKDSNVYRAGALLASSLPLFISFAITQGIVPLLFLQLLYGPAYYTSSVIMAVPWLSVIGLLLLAYYSSYTVIYRHLKRGDTGVRAPLLMFVASLLFLAIGYLFVNNMTLMLEPQKWLAAYQANPYGMSMNHADPQLIPRFMHFLLAAFAVTGLMLGAFGYFKKSDEQFSTWLIRKGSLMFLIATFAQVGVGLWFLFSLPADVNHNLLGGDKIATGVFMGAMTFGLIGLGGGAAACATGTRKAYLLSALPTVVTILLMIVTRHEVRQMMLNPYLRPETVPVKTQWDILIAFIVLAVGLIAYLTWLVRMVWRAYNQPQSFPTPSENPKEPAGYGTM